MNQSPAVFVELIELASRYEFKNCVERYCSRFVPRKFSFWDQFLAMAFAQVTFRESLRDIEVCLQALGSRTYQLGFRGRVTRSTLADANNERDWRVWCDFANILIAQARKLYAVDDLEFQFANAAYALDSTTITLCLTLFPWARYQSKKRAVKLHTQLDLRGNIPSFALISQAKTADVNFLDEILLEAGALYVMDRGYFDFGRFFRFTLHGAFFVTRFKSNISYRRVQIFFRSKHGPIRCDAAIVPLSREARKSYPQRLRLVEYYDSEKSRTFFFVTNNFLLSAQTIADIYRSRWRIELFFKWIKQHLRIKAFFGTSENAVKTQIWIAIAVYALIAILKKTLALDQSLHSILQVLSLCSTEKTPILRAFSPYAHQNPAPQDTNQLNLFSISTGQ